MIVGIDVFIFYLTQFVFEQSQNLINVKTISIISFLFIIKY